MLKFNKARITLKSSIGSEALIEVFNESNREILFTAKPNIPNCLKICGKDKLREWIGANEKMVIVIKCVDEIKDRGDSFYIRFEEVIHRKECIILIEVQEEENAYPRAKAPQKVPRSEVSELTCDICYEMFDTSQRIPRIIKECGHTVCQVCIKSLLKQNDNKYVICPQDKKKTTVENGIESLPKNYSLLQLLDESKTGNSSVKTEIPKSSSSPQRETKKKEEPKKKEEKINQPVTDGQCSQHPNEKGRFICTSKECKIETKLMCTECMGEDGRHEGHSYVSSKQYFQKRAEVQNQLGKINAIKVCLEKKFENCKQAITNLQTAYNAINEKAAKLYSQLEKATNSVQTVSELALIEESKKAIEENNIAWKELKMYQKNINCVQNEVSKLLSLEVIDDKIMESLWQSVEQVSNKFSHLREIRTSKGRREEWEKYYENMKCQTHNRETVKFYCTDSKCSSKSKLMCVECMSENGEHEEHSYGSLKKLNENRGKLIIFEEEMKEFGQWIIAECVNLERKVAQRDKDNSKVMNSLKEKHSKKIDSIKAKKNEAEAMLSKNRTDDMKLLQNQKSQIESCLEELSKFRTDLENNLSSGEIDKKRLEAIGQFALTNVQISLKCHSINLDDDWNLQIES